MSCYEPAGNGYNGQEDKSMDHQQNPRIAYVLKVYPRFSQTFVVNEILAHEESGLPLEIFSLRLSDDTRFHEALAQVQSPLHHVLKPRGKVDDFLRELREAGARFPSALQVIQDNQDVTASDMQQAMMLASCLQARGIDHMHAHFGTIATTVARLAARLSGISYSFTAHARDIFHESVDRDRFREKLEDAAAVVTVSDYNLDYLGSHYGTASERVIHINNGLDLEQFSYSGPGERPPLVLGVGRLVEKKGFDYLIRAFAGIAENTPGACCEIIGGGVLEEALRAQISRLGLEGSVRLLGPQPQSEVRRKMSQASVIAAPCIVASDGDRDGLPTVLLEAMAMGTPIVSTDVTGIPEILDDGVTGLEVPQRDPEALAAACTQLLQDAALRQKLAEQARAVVEQDFDIRKNSVQLRAMFSSILQRTPNLTPVRVQRS